MGAEKEGSETLLRLAGEILDAVMEGLDSVDEESRKEIVKRCGRACAEEETWGPAVAIADRISEQEQDLERVIERMNEEIAWCGDWMLEGERITCTCEECGCPLVKNGVVKHTGVFCYCSLGWVETVFGILLKREVHADLEKAIGFGDDVCMYAVHI